MSSISISIPLLKNGLYTMHDDQQVARLFLFDKAIKSGQFPVRWVDELGFGFGYPLFVFYPPFVYMLGDIIHNLGFNFISSIKIVFFLSVFLSGISMLILAKELWGRAAATVAAIFYIYAPYRALDVYVRGALAESFSFVWLPLILWSFYKISKEQTVNDVYLCGIFLALLMITHNLIFLPYSLILVIYIISLFYLSKNKKIFFKHTLLACILGAGISAFFWVPSLMEKKYTIVDQILLTNLADYKIHFVYPQQLWNWQWGFGGSAKGLMDGISFKIGKIHLLICAFALVIMIIHYNWGKITKVKLILPSVFLFLFLISAFMTTAYSEIVWAIVKPLAYLQFPWRFLTFATLFSSLIAGYFIYLLKLPFLRLTISGVVLLVLVIPNHKLFSPQAYREDLTDQAATSSEKINWDVSKSSFEYMSKGVDLKTLENGSKMLNINKSDLPEEKLAIVSGNVDIEITTAKPNKLYFKTMAKDDAYLVANIINFPGWELKIDNIGKNFFVDNKYKLISFQVPYGNHSVSLDFKNTPTIQMANTISLLSLIGTLVGMLYLQFNKSKIKP